MGTGGLNDAGTEPLVSAAVVAPDAWALCNIGWLDEALQKRIKDAGAEPLVRAAVAAPDATDKPRSTGRCCWTGRPRYTVFVASKVITIIIVKS